MIDFHSHILPCMDDGSASVQESVALLSLLREQGVTRVFLTPHFDPMRDTPASFLTRRGASLERLSPFLSDAHPSVSLGAEVVYFPGISRMEALSELRLAGTRLLLLEMPMCPWSESTVRELMELARVDGIRVLLAHVERYLDLQSPAVIAELLSLGILMQVNASFFLRLRTRRRALRLLRSGHVHLLGSDTHNLSSRPPRIADAISVIERRLGKEHVERLRLRGESLLDDFDQNCK